MTTSVNYELAIFIKIAFLILKNWNFLLTRFFGPLQYKNLLLIYRNVKDAK